MMPFGLMSILVQKMMDDVLQGRPFPIMYVDDVAIFSENIDDHVRHCEQVFGRIQKLNHNFKLTRCGFGNSGINLLDQVVNQTALQGDAGKNNNIVHDHPSKKVTDLRSFLLLAGYRRRFIKNFAEISPVLHATTSVLNDV